MAISITVSPVGSSPTEIQSTTRSIRSINATITASTDDVMETINFVNASLSGVSEPGLTITPGNTSVSLVGTYADPFSDVFTFVSKGSSTKLEAPTVVVGTENMPANRELYNLNQDLSQTETKTYSVIVTYNTNLTQGFTVTHDILNELEGIRSFIDTYYD